MRMQVIKPFVTLFVGLLLSLTTPAQTQNVSGTVTSSVDNSPLIGVTVTVKETNNSTITDNSGSYSIDAEKGQTLVFTYVGYEPQSRVIGNSRNISVALSVSDQNKLQDVVVVGYGTQKRVNLTGAVSTVDVDKVLSSRPITDIARGLQGAVPGLTVTTPTGEIGTNPTIRLRGVTGSLNAPGGAQPLILVDNVQIDDLSLINPADIESISVLKDAASTSIYGSRAAWGVVLITTKKGKIGQDRSSISYTNNFSFSKPTTIPKIADAAAGAEMAFKALQRTNPNTTQFGVVGMYFDSIGIEKIKEWEATYGGQDLGPEMVMGRDFEIRNNKLFFYRPWEVGDLFLRNTTPMQTHNLTFSGSSAKTAYNLNLGYLDQGGVLKVNPDKFERYNVNLGVTSNVTNWLTVRSKIILSKGTKTRPFYFSSETYDPWYYLYRWPKIYPYGTYEGHPFRSAITEVQQAKMNTYENNLARVSVGGTFKILKGLTLDADYSYTSNNDHDHQTGGSVSAINFWAGGGSLDYGPYTSASYDRAIYESFWNNRNTIKAYATYNTNLGSNHEFKAIAGTDVEVYEYWSQYTQRRGLLDPNFGEPNLATGDQFADNSRGHWATLGYFGRLNYSFMDKFLLELNGRFDGSSKFPSNSHWGFFPSMSAGYIITNESFMDFAQPVLSFLKIRGSWGSIGNENIGNYRFLSTMPSTTSGWYINGINQPTVSTPGLVSPSLTWETVTTLDFGVDSRFLENNLGISFDWYKRTTSDMLTSGVTVPSSLGTGAPVINFGAMATTGWELAVDYNHDFDNGFTLGVAASLSDFTEKITKYANTTKGIYTNYEGKTLGDIWGYQTDRFFTKEDFEQDANGNLVLVGGKPVLLAKTPSQAKWESGWFFYGPGDIKYKDLNSDGVIDYGTNTLDDHGDLTVIGNTTPRYQYGFRVNAAFKGFDLSMFIQGVGKREFYPNTPIVVAGYRPGEAWYEHQLDYWTPENPDAFYPRPTDQSQSNNTRNFLPQTKYLLNMAYTRLKNLTLGYSLPESLIGKAHLQKARIYISGENLMEFTKLNVPVDPETDYTTPGLNDPNTFGRIYPYSRNYSFGIQVTF
jgi:TonB-linked SusC/RagA family outer membrane protein